jgi:hypothetical protein
MDIEFGNLKREELKAAVTLAARAYRNYAYVALYFPDDEERFRSLHAFMNCVMKSNFGKADLLAARQQGRLVGRATLESPDFQPPSLKHLGKGVNKANASQFMSYETAMPLFRSFIECCK